MTVTAQTPATAYLGDGARTLFLMGFTASDPTTVRVRVDGVPLALTTDFVVEGPNVRFLSAPDVDAVIEIYRWTPEDQLRAFPNRESITPGALEQGFDKLTRLIQETRAMLARAILGRVGDEGLLLPGRDDRKNLVLGFNASGDLVVTDARGVKGDPGGNAMAVGLFTDISGLTIPVGTDIIHTSGHGTRGLGAARYVVGATTDPAASETASSTNTANGRPVRLAEATVTPEMFGATGANDGVDDMAKANLALASGRPMQPTAATYYGSSTLAVSDNMVIEPNSSTWIKSTLTGPLITITGQHFQVWSFAGRFASQPSGTDTNAVGARFTGTCAYGIIGKLKLERTYLGVQQGNLVGSSASADVTVFFSCSCGDWYIRDFVYGAMNIRAENGANTGNRWGNIYVNGKIYNTEAKRVPSGPVVAVTDTDEFPCQQFNIEWIGDYDNSATFQNNLILTFNSCIVIQGLHLEGIDIIKDTGSLFQMGPFSNLYIYGFLLVNSIIGPVNPASFTALVNMYDNGADFRISGGRVKAGGRQSLTNLRLGWTNGGARSGCAIEVIGMRSWPEAVADTSAMLTSDNPILKRFNNSFNYSSHRLAPRTRGNVTQIAAGALTITDPIHRIEPEGLAATDDLDTITGGVQDDIVILAINNNGRQVRVRNVGNIRPKSWFWLRNTNARLVLRKDEAGLWVEESRSIGTPYSTIEDGDNKTIAAGVVTVDAQRHRIDTEGAAASDDLDTINGGGPEPRVLYLRSADAGRVVTVKHATGNIWLNGGADKDLHGVNDLVLVWDPGGSLWAEPL